MRLKVWLGVLLLGSCMPVLAAELRLFTEEYRPLSYSEKGKLTGMAVEVVEQLVEQTGQATHIELLPWARGYHLAQREANVGLFSMVRTPEREALFQWPHRAGSHQFLSAAWCRAECAWAGGS